MCRSSRSSSRAFPQSPLPEHRAPVLRDPTHAPRSSFSTGAQKSIAYGPRTAPTPWPWPALSAPAESNSNAAGRRFGNLPPGLPFQKKKADMLVGVARLIGLSEQTLTHLPHGWSVLYHLGRLEHDLLDRLVRDGEVHPELTHDRAKALVRRRGKPLKTKPKRPAVKTDLPPSDE